MVVHDAYSCQPRVSILGYSFIILKNIIFLSRSNREIDHLKYISKTQLPWMLWPLGPSELVVLRLQQPQMSSPEIGSSTFPVCKEQKHGLSGSIPNQNHSKSNNIQMKYSGFHKIQQISTVTRSHCTTSNHALPHLTTHKQSASICQ